MKSIELFLDESGRMGAGQSPMNVTGIALVSPDGQAADDFHQTFYTYASKKSLLAGLCDRDNRQPGKLNCRANYLKKRISHNASEKEREAHTQHISEFVILADNIAKDRQIQIGAFSFIFPATSVKPWLAPEAWENELLDRSYLERVKDVLELLLFETPWMRKHLTTPCLLSLDLPTRSVTAQPPTELPIGELSDKTWVRWGLKNEGQGQGQLRVSSLATSDAAEILTSVLNRRKHGFPECVKVGRSRCVRLMDWDGWKRDFSHLSERNRFFQKDIPPFQIHYSADFLANAIYHGLPLVRNATVSKWLQRGFLLNAASDKIDPWIGACRLFANGDRVGALQMLYRKNATSTEKVSGDFFRARSREWFRELSGDDLRALFREFRPMTAIGQPNLNRPTMQSSGGIKSE